MSLMDQIQREVKRRKGWNLKYLCDKACVSYTSVLATVNHGADIKQSTLIKLQKPLEKKFVLIDEDL